jgi:hypothetical protein
VIIRERARSQWGNLTFKPNSTFAPRNRIHSRERELPHGPDARTHTATSGLSVAFGKIPHETEFSLR